MFSNRKNSIHSVHRRGAFVRWPLSLLLLILALTLPGLQGGTAENHGAADGGDHVAGELVVRLVPGLELEAVHFLQRRTVQMAGDTSLDILCRRFGLAGATEGNPLGRDGRGRVFLLAFGDGAPDPRELQQAFLSSPLVAAAEPNLIFHGFATPPDDPFYHSSGSWKQPYGDLWGLQAIDAARAWDLSEPDSPVVIGLVDSGLDFDHPDVGEGVWRNPGEIPGNGIDDDGNGFIDDVRGYDFTAPAGSPEAGNPIDLAGHGTNSFGIMSATFSNGFGIPGLAFNCRTMPVKGLGDDGSGSIFDLSRAIQYAVDNGARVLCLGWGAAGSSALLHETITAADEAGVVIICAAGNSGLPVGLVIPAAYSETIAVGASEPGGGVYELSNHGPELDLVAPGIDILTTRAAYSDPAGDGSRFVGNDFFRSGGTSAAAPHVAAAAGLLLARRENLTADEVRTALRATAIPLAGEARVSAESGYGLLDAGGLLDNDNPVGLRLTSPGRNQILFNNVQLEVAGRARSKEPFHWRISWGAGQFPSSFETMAQSDAPVQGLVQVSAARPTTGLAPGRYTVRLQAWRPGTPPLYEERVSLVIDNSRGLLGGTILSAGTGDPLAAVEVSAYNADTLVTAGVVHSDGDGRYLFSQGLPAGFYYLRAGSGFTDVIPQYFDGVPSLAGAEAVEVRAGEETGGIDFSLSRRGSISGTINLRGTGEPLSGATVSIYYPAGTLMRQAVSGPDGGYGFSNLIEQHYFIGAHHARHRYVPRFYDEAGFIDDATPVNVTNDNDTGGVDLALKRHGGAISGVVRRQEGSIPLSGIGVEALGQGSGFRRQAVSGSDGTYVLDDLPSGSYRVSAAGSAGYRRQYFPDGESPLDAELLTLTGDQQLTGTDFSLRDATFADITAESPDLARPFGSAVYGLCWRDLDNDGDPDLFTAPANGRCRLLLNDRESGLFIDRTVEQGAAAGGLKTALSAADLDNDGDVDLHLPRYGPFGSTFPDALLQNSGSGGPYRDAAVELGLANPPEAIDCCWADFDNNGFLDLFVVNLFQPDALFLNTGDGRFRESALAAGVTGDVNEATAAASACDMDGDGLTDLLVVVDEFQGSPRHNHLYHNLGDGRFEEAAMTAGISLLSRSLCAAWGDTDNDGDPDLFIGGVDYDTLLRNEGAGRFTDVTAGSGIYSEHTARGACWVDADLDGFLDLFLLRPGDAGNRLLLGGGDFTFTNVSVEAGLEEDDQWTAFAWADHDLDGDPDLALADGSGRVRLLRNDLALSSTWIAIDLEGRAAPRDGTGAVVHLLAGERTIVRHSGDLRSPRSKGDRRLLIGLGDYPGTTVRADIIWSSGTRQSVEELPLNQNVRIVEAVPETWIVAGTGQVPGNPARIRCFLPGGREVSSGRINPFATGSLGVETACGDLDGDGVDEIIAGPGPSPWFAPQIRAFDPLNGPLSGGSFLAFSHGGYGALIGCGDLDGDGTDELAACPGPGPSYGAVVSLHRYSADLGWARVPGVPVFFAYGPPVSGGALPAFGDLDGDGRDELLTAPGALAANGSHIRGWRLGPDGVEPMAQVNFLAYQPGLGYGARLACGDLDGDGRDELVTAPGPGAGYGAHLRVWRLSADGGGVEQVAQLLADLPGNRGARIACGDLDGDGRDEVVGASGPDPGATSLVRAWRLEGSRLVRVDGVAFHTYQQFAGGVSLAVGRLGGTVQHLVK